MTATPTTLDARTVSIAAEATVSIRPVQPARRPVPPVAPTGYPPPHAYRVPPLRHPHAPAGAARVGVPWGPPSGPLPVAWRPGPAGRPVPFAPPMSPARTTPARRRPATALVMAALLFVLLVGGGIAAYVGFSVGPAYSTGAVTDVPGTDATGTDATGATVGQ